MFRRFHAPPSEQKKRSANQAFRRPRATRSSYGANYVSGKKGSSTPSSGPAFLIRAEECGMFPPLQLSQFASSSSDDTRYESRAGDGAVVVLRPAGMEVDSAGGQSPVTFPPSQRCQKTPGGGPGHRLGSDLGTRFQFMLPLSHWLESEDDITPGRIAVVGSAQNWVERVTLAVERKRAYASLPPPRDDCIPAQPSDTPLLHERHTTADAPHSPGVPIGVEFARLASGHRTPPPPPSSSCLPPRARSLPPPPRARAHFSPSPGIHFPPVISKCLPIKASSLRPRVNCPSF